jgi:phage terminase large subunit
VDILGDIERAVRGEGPRYLCYPAGHGIGKTFIIAQVAIWGAASAGRSLVLTTAPTWRQVKEVLWDEINYSADRSAFPGDFLQTEFTLGNGSVGRGVSTNDSGNFQGYHRGRMVVILDEAPGLEPAIWEVIQRGIAINEDVIIIAIGNPVEPAGPFHEASKSHRWKTRHLSCLDHPNVINRKDLIPGAVSYRACLEMVEDYCEVIEDDALIANLEAWQADMLADPEPPRNRWAHAVLDEEGDCQGLYWNPSGWTGPVWYLPSPIVQSRMLGLFPDQGENVLIPLKWIKRAMARGEDLLRRLDAYHAGKITLPEVPEWRPQEPCVCAMDVARHGPDSTVIGARRGRVVLPMREYRQQDTTASALRFVEAYGEYGADFGAIDIGTFGAGVFDMVANDSRNTHISLVPIDFGASPGVKNNTVQFLNKRAQMYWGLRMLLQMDMIDLPPDDVLEAQLSSIRYKMNREGQQIQIESKKDMKKRGVKSPDRADTLAMLCDEAIEGAWDMEMPWASGATPSGGEEELGPYGLAGELLAEGARVGAW